MKSAEKSTLGMQHCNMGAMLHMLQCCRRPATCNATHGGLEDPVLRCIGLSVFGLNQQKKARSRCFSPSPLNAHFSAGGLAYAH